MGIWNVVESFQCSLQREPMVKSVAFLAQELVSPDVSRRRVAAEQLAQNLDAAREAAVELARAAGDDDEQVRQWASTALEDLGAPRAADVPRLVELLSYDRADAGYWAATLLGRLGADAAPAVPDLAAALGPERELGVRERAAWALGRLGPAATAARGALEQAAASNERRLARLAREALGRLEG